MIKNVFTNLKKYLSKSESRARDRYRRAFWTAFLTGLARIVSVLINLISVPLTINYLGEEIFGLWMTITTSISLLQFTDLGIGNGLLNKIAESNGLKNNDSIQKLVSSGFAVLSVIAFIVMGLFLIINMFDPWANIFNATTNEAVALVQPTTAIIVVFFALNMALSAIIRVNFALQEGYINGFWQIVGNILSLAGLFISIHFGADLSILVAAYLFGPTFTTIINGIILFYYRHPEIKPSCDHINWSVAKSIGSLGIWFLIFQIVVAITNATPNLIISHLEGLKKVSVFTVTLKLASVSVLLQSVLLGSLWPAYSEAKANGDWYWIRLTLYRSLRVSLGIGLISGVAIIFLGKDIISIWAGSNVVPPNGVLFGIACWVITSSIYGPLTMLLNGIGIVKAQAVWGIIFALFMLGIFYILTLHFQLIGSAWAYGISFTLPSIVVAGYYSDREFKKNCKGK